MNELSAAQYPGPPIGIKSSIDEPLTLEQRVTQLEARLEDQQQYSYALNERLENAEEAIKHLRRQVGI